VKSKTLGVGTVSDLAQLASALARARGDASQTQVNVAVQNVVVSPEQQQQMQEKLARYHQRLKMAEPERLAQDRATRERMALDRAKVTTVPDPAEPVPVAEARPENEDAYLNRTLSPHEWERRRKAHVREMLRGPGDNP